MARLTQAYGTETAAVAAAMMAELLGYSASKFYNPTLQVWIVAVNRK